jgi:hypothetical protein
MKNLKLIIMIMSCFYGLCFDIGAQGTIEYNSAQGDPTLLLYETESDFVRMYLQNTNDSTGQYWSLAAKVGATDANSRLHFYNKGNTSSGYVMAMTGERRVGIGTLNPDATLTVKQALDNDQMGFRIVDFSGNNSGRLWMNGDDFHIHNGSGVHNGLTIKDDKKIGVFTQIPEASFDIYESDINYTDGIFAVRRKPSIPLASKLLFEVKGDDNTYALRLGVGEEDPSDRLHINSSANENALRVQVDGHTKLRVLSNGGPAIGGNNTSPPVDGLYVDGQVLIGSSTGTAKLHVKSGANEDPIRAVVDGSTKFKVVSNGGTAIGLNATVVPSDGLYVHGNVHVGTSLGATGYTMAVDGKVICEELTVQLSGSWPDYVFQEGHEMKSLEELEQYIIENKHLPGIPAAVEIEADGIHMSEISAALLEKIEELTLHTIRQEKLLQKQAILINSILNDKTW